MKRTVFPWPVISLFLASLNAYAQTPIPLDSAHWQIKASEAIQEEYLGRHCLKLTNGTALLPDAHFTNGIIELDIALEKGRYFPGIRFRVRDTANGEFYYLRPHQSGNPDAMQYFPQFNGSGPWQLYYGEGYNNPHFLPFDRWLHIRLLISGSRGEVYFDDEKAPVLYMHALKRPVAPGMIELQNLSPVPTRFANFSYTPMDSVPLLNPPKPAPVLPATVIMDWQVSQPFAEAMIKDRILLPSPGSRKSPNAKGARDSPAFNPSTLRWQSFRADERGVVDLSRLAGAAKGRNTIICRLTVECDRDQVRKLTFGFSDRVQVYLNNRLLYAGEDVFMSRDYRFLGTIGYFDALWLPLKKGKNEIWMAVSEDYGGWGIQARLDSL